MKAKIVRAFHFSCGYAYKLADLSETENREIYGDLSKYDGFGRNFRAEVSYTGKIDPLSGMIVNLVQIDAWISSLSQKLDHRFLNSDLEFFKKNVPTPENIARFIFEELQSAKTKEVEAEIFNVRLFETENRWIDYALKPFENE